MESGNGKELESRIASALQNVKHLFPENRSSSSSESPYYDVNHINQDGVGKYRVVSFKYYSDRFVAEPDVVSFGKAFTQFCGEIKNSELDVFVDSYKEFKKVNDKLQELTHEEKKEKLKHKVIKERGSGPDPYIPDATRLRLLPFKLDEGRVAVDEANPVITASLDTNTRRIFFGYRKGDAKAKHIVARFMSWYMDGRNKHETTEFVRDLRDRVEHSPDSTITYLG
jgi:hypothetical protein